MINPWITARNHEIQILMIVRSLNKLIKQIQAEGKKNENLIWRNILQKQDVFLNCMQTCIYYWNMPYEMARSSSSSTGNLVNLSRDIQHVNVYLSS